MSALIDDLLAFSPAWDDRSQLGRVDLGGSWGREVIADFECTADAESIASRSAGPGNGGFVPVRRFSPTSSQRSNPRRPRRSRARIGAGGTKMQGSYSSSGQRCGLDMNRPGAPGFPRLHGRGVEGTGVGLPRSPHRHPHVGRYGRRPTRSRLHVLRVPRAARDGLLSQNPSETRKERDGTQRIKGSPGGRFACSAHRLQAPGGDLAFASAVSCSWIERALAGAFSISAFATTTSALRRTRGGSARPREHPTLRLMISGTLSGRRSGRLPQGGATDYLLKPRLPPRAAARAIPKPKSMRQRKTGPTSD